MLLYIMFLLYRVVLHDLRWISGSDRPLTTCYVTRLGLHWSSFRRSSSRRRWPCRRGAPRCWPSVVAAEEINSNIKSKLKSPRMFQNVENRSLVQSGPTGFNSGIRSIVFCLRDVILKIERDLPNNI